MSPPIVHIDCVAGLTDVFYYAAVVVFFAFIELTTGKKAPDLLGKSGADRGAGGGFFPTDECLLSYSNISNR
jgi:hypothetical protein